MHIAFFDSGLGGLSISQAFFAHAQSHLVNVRTCSYIADTGAYPYGNKDDAWLAARIVSVLGGAIKQIKPDLVVVACNTASTLALQQLRDTFNLPFIGVVPAIKPAVAVSQSGVVGVLATPATVARDYTAQLITDHAPQKQILLHGCTQLVAQAERALLFEPLDTHVVRLALTGLLKQQHGQHIDTIVLACTHFPLLKTAMQHEIQTLHKTPIAWVDSGDAIARRIIALASALPNHNPLPNNDALLKNNAQPCEYRHQLITTGGSHAQRYATLFQQQPKLLNPCAVFASFAHILLPLQK